MSRRSPSARRLTRPVLVVPVALLAVAVLAFVGYGRWTRSTPVHYERGGDAFAVLSSAAPTPRPSPSGSRPTAAARGVEPTPASSHEGDVEPGQELSSSQAEPAAGGRNTVQLPRVGRYDLRVEGSEKVDFGPVSFCSQQLPRSTSLVVTKAAGESATSYDFDVPFFPGSTGKHDERHVYRYTASGVFLDYEIATVTCQGVRQSSDTSFTPPQQRVRLPLAVGASWTSRGGDDDRTESSSSRVARTETVLVAGQRVPTFVIETTTTFTGAESGSRTQTWWWAPRGRCP